MGRAKRGTNRSISTEELSRLVEEYYRRVAERRELGSAYARWLGAVRGDLAELQRTGANSAFLLHVLVCTRLSEIAPSWKALPAVAELSPRRRSRLLGAVRTLRQLGEDQILKLFGGKQADWGHRFFSGLIYLEQQLTTGFYANPAFQIGLPGMPGRRGQEAYRRACIVCVMSELEAQAKRLSRVATLLEKFEVLGPRRGSTVNWIKKRYQRDMASREIQDPFSALSTIVSLLRSSFQDLKEHLAPESPKPVPPKVLREKASRWRVSETVYRQRFNDFCRIHGFQQDRAGLKEFELSLRRSEKTLGPRGLWAEVFRDKSRATRG